MSLEPIGLTSREDVVLKRMNNIAEVIQRYINEGLEVPQDWVTEYFELDEWCRNNDK